MVTSRAAGRLFPNCRVLTDRCANRAVVLEHQPHALAAASVALASDQATLARMHEAMLAKP